MQNLSIAFPFVGFLLSQLLSILFALENSNRCDGYDVSSKLAVYPTIASTLENYAAENINGTSGLIESLSNSTSDSGIVAHLAAQAALALIIWIEANLHSGAA